MIFFNLGILIEKKNIALASAPHNSRKSCEVVIKRERSSAHWNTSRQK